MAGGDAPIPISWWESSLTTRHWRLGVSAHTSPVAVLALTARPHRRDNHGAPRRSLGSLGSCGRLLALTALDATEVGTASAKALGHCRVPQGFGRS